MLTELYRERGIRNPAFYEAAVGAKIRGKKARSEVSLCRFRVLEGVTVSSVTSNDLIHWKKSQTAKEGQEAEVCRAGVSTCPP
ncbi:MAG: hypothetical protein GX589_03070 [Deltaproteobacteria bacterium]|nr:hypothetical protein [Deltaproteobacteria bacterium]